MPETSSTKRASQNNWNTERTNSIPEIPTTPRNTFFAKLRDVLEAEFKEVASLPVSGTRLAHSLGAPGGFEQIGRRVVALAAAYTALQQGIEPARLELDANLDLLSGQLLKITEPASPKPQFETATETDAFSQQNAAIRHIAGLTERQREDHGTCSGGPPQQEHRCRSRH